MAYAAIVSLAQTIRQMLNDDQYPIALEEEQQIVSLDKYVTLLQAYLEDFPQKADNLEGKMIDLAFKAENIIECSRGKRTQQLKRVTHKIESIVGQVMQIKDRLGTRNLQLSAASSSSRSRAVAPIHKDVMVGFDADLIAIKTRLCQDSPTLQVIPIFGMGGIGKTTLARNVYNDLLIVERFDIRAWITVSLGYITQEVISGLLASIKKFDVERFEGGRDEEKVFKSLKCRRFLIVMDDMWSIEAWDNVRNIFPDDHNGSRIILTTRLLDVAAYPDPYSRLHEMHLMDADLSWKLLQKKVFVDEECAPELNNIGKDIARSCGGLPLAIVVIAGLLSVVSKTTTLWGEIAANVRSTVSTEDGYLDKILSLSYSYLPHHLRPCFLYMGGFPEDHEIRVSKLIKLLIGEGFLTHRSRSKIVEAEAEECLEDLVMRSLVFVTKRKRSNGKIKSCSLHDLMRDLCIRKAYQEKFLLNVDKNLPIRIGNNHPRRVSGDFSFLQHPLMSIHTILSFKYVSLPSLITFRSLRVLDAVETYAVSLPPQLFELFHLRYFTIRYVHHVIPAAISKLQNLQIFIIYTWRRMKCISMYLKPLLQEIWRMPQLRHVRFCGRFPNPEGVDYTHLENLQTLSLVSHYMCTERILKMIPNLKKLGVDCTDFQGGTYLNNLVYLQQLEKLELCSDLCDASWRKEHFTFPMMLHTLSLSGLRLPWAEMTVVGSLPNLQVLKLKDFVCKGSRWETNEGEFPQLEFLLIEDSSLWHWITESSHFPRLKSLLIHRCPRLQEIPDDVREIPTLELIEIKDRGNMSLVDSAKWIQKEQQSSGNDALLVRCMEY